MGSQDPLLSSQILYHWATGVSEVSKGQTVGIDWNRIAWLHSHVGSNPICDLDFFWVYVSGRIYIISCCYFSVRSIFSSILRCYSKGPEDRDLWG